MVTIKDVARHAGVSITTASYVLNGKGQISEATRKRVLAAAEELNYHPNAFARHLKKRKTRTIGVFISRLGGAFYEEVLEGIHEAILQGDYELIICPETRTTRRILTQRQVDGAIVFDSKISSDLIARLAWERFPIVTLDRYLEADHVFPLLVDNPGGTKEVFHHLYSQGVRRFAFVAGAADSFDNAERRQVFVDEAAKNALAVACYEGSFTRPSGYQVAREIIASGNLPEAVFCANDQMAIGFMEALQEHQLLVPYDVAVVGFDDIAVAQYLQPALSTVRVSRLDWGSAAVTRLIDLLEHDRPFDTRRIPTQFIQRQSSTRSLAIYRARHGFQDPLGDAPWP